jgi:AcrR family transcriptional regulator
MSTSVGRPRSAEADEAIIDAAVDLFVDRGYDGLTIEAVACRAGVGKSTVYRRFPGKLELLTAVFEERRPPEVAVPDTGSLRSDLMELARGLRSALLDSDLGRTIPAAVAAAARHPDVAEAHERLIRERRRKALAVVERAVARGELAPTTDADLVVDLVAGPIFYRAFVTRAPLDDEVLAEIVRHAAPSAV